MTNERPDTYGVNPLVPDAPPRPRERESAPGADRPQEQSTAQQGDALVYDGRGRQLGGIVLGNTLLGLVTLGFYRFWGKTRLRRYIWSRLRLFGDRLEYTGTGKELFFGFLIALAVLIPLSIVFGLTDAFLASGSTVLQIGMQIVWYLLFGFLIGMAIYRARRYRMTRTLWRGIRFGLTGSSSAYALRFLGYGLLTFLTLGLARPVGEVRLQSFVMNNSWFGTGQFSFQGRAGDLFGRWVLCWLLIPFTLGLSLIWYAAARTRYFAEQTEFQTLGFSLPVTFGDICRILLPYLLVVAFLCGLVGAYLVGSGLVSIMKTGVDGDPGALGSVFPAIVVFVVVFLLLPALQIMLVTHRFLNLVADRLAIEGEADLESIVQNLQTAPKTGEGLADALDVGGGVEIGF